MQAYHPHRTYALEPIITPSADQMGDLITLLRHASRAYRQRFLVEVTAMS